MTTWKHRLPVLASVLLVLYVTAYLGLSRRGYAESRAWNTRGFYYFTPEDSDSWRLRNYGCAYLFAPLNTVDRCLGTGMTPACEPMWGLSSPLDRRADYSVGLAELGPPYNALSNIRSLRINKPGDGSDGERIRPSQDALPVGILPGHSTATRPHRRHLRFARRRRPT
jgi:hypothetical protein